MRPLRPSRIGVLGRRARDRERLRVAVGIVEDDGQHLAAVGERGSAALGTPFEDRDAAPGGSDPVRRSAGILEREREAAERGSKLGRVRRVRPAAPWVTDARKARMALGIDERLDAARLSWAAARLPAKKSAAISRRISMTRFSAHSWEYFRGCVRDAAAGSALSRAAETIDHVVVDHADRLHERVADRRADEPEAALRQVLAHRVRLRRPRRTCRSCASGSTRLAADEAPEVRVEAAELLAAPRGTRFALRDRARDLEAVADDAGVGEERARSSRGRKRAHLRGIEAVERPAVVRRAS